MPALAYKGLLPVVYCRFHNCNISSWTLSSMNDRLQDSTSWLCFVKALYTPASTYRLHLCKITLQRYVFLGCRSRPINARHFPWCFRHFRHTLTWKIRQYSSKYCANVKDSSTNIFSQHINDQKDVPSTLSTSTLEMTRAFYSTWC